MIKARLWHTMSQYDIERHTNTKMSSNIKIEKQCVYCRNTFIARTVKTKYCSHKCNQRHYKQKKRQEKINSVIEEQVGPSTKNLLRVDLRDKEFLNVAQTALLIGVSKRTVYRMLQEKTLCFYKIGSRTIIKRNDVDKLFIEL